MRRKALLIELRTDADGAATPEVGEIATRPVQHTAMELPEATAKTPAAWLAAHGDAPQGQDGYPTPRPHQGHDHLGRREHLPRRGRARSAIILMSPKPSSASPTDGLSEAVKAIVVMKPGKQAPPPTSSISRASALWASKTLGRWIRECAAQPSQGRFCEEFARSTGGRIR
jgi:hypothetical protein